jgi:hypothetical protein
VAAAIGVCVAAVYYVMNLRVQQENMEEMTKNRRVTLTSSLMQPFMTEEGMRHFIDLVNMEWIDLDDFSRRYDSRVNPENFAKRMSMWNLCECLGSLYKDGLIDLKTLQGGSLGEIEYMWIKFKPIIEMFRRTDFGPGAYENFEFIAGKLHELRISAGETEPDRMSRVIEEHVEAQ